MAKNSKKATKGLTKADSDGGGDLPRQLFYGGFAIAGALAAMNSNGGLPWLPFTAAWLVALGCSLVGLKLGAIKAPASSRLLIAAALVLFAWAVWDSGRPKAHVQIDGFEVGDADGGRFKVNLRYKNTGSFAARDVQVVYEAALYNAALATKELAGAETMRGALARAQTATVGGSPLMPNIPGFTTMWAVVPSDEVKQALQQGQLNGAFAGVLRYRDWWPVQQQVTFCIFTFGVGPPRSCQIDSDY